MPSPRRSSALAAFANSHSSSTRIAGVEVDEAAEHAQHVFLAPHDTLRHAGGAAGVEDVDVVVGASAEVALGRRRRERVVVGDRADRSSVGARAVVDRDQVPQHRQRVAHGGDARRELRVVHERDEVGVVEEVAQLGFDVAVVDVDRNRAQLVGGEDRLDELVAVERRRCRRGRPGPMPWAARWCASRLACSSSCAYVRGSVADDRARPGRGRGRRRAR